MTTDELIARLETRLSKVPGLRFAVLFGSTTTRGWHGARDVDVAISFSRPVALLEIGAIAIELEDLLGREVDIVDLDDASTLLRWEVVRTGRLISASDRASWLTFQARVPVEMADLRPYYERQSEGLRRTLEGTRWSASTS